MKTQIKDQIKGSLALTLSVATVLFFLSQPSTQAQGWGIWWFPLPFIPAIPWPK